MALIWRSTLILLYLESVASAASGTGAPTRYTVATFNIQNLGPGKMKNQATVQLLKQIMARYVVIAIQELQDRTGTAVRSLLQTLNEGMSSSDQYDYIVSDRVGDTKGEEEQYALFYKPSIVRVKKLKQYPDPKDYYSRVPHLARVHFNNTGIPEFVLVNLHTKPDSTATKLTVQEIDHLVDVYDYIENDIGLTNALFVGDLNADGQYVRKKDWKTIRFRNDPRFRWLISDDVDTTVGPSDMAYDRIVVAGEELQTAVVPNSAVTYHFDDEFQIDKKEALKVSDHYPVEVALRVRSNRRQG